MKANKTVTPTKFAFWKYDRFPFVLGASICEPIERWHSQNEKRAFAPSYGGHVVVEHTTSIEEGEATLQKLRALEAEYERESGEVHAKHIAKALAIAPWLKKLHNFANVSADVPSNANDDLVKAAQAIEDCGVYFRLHGYQSDALIEKAEKLAIAALAKAGAAAVAQ